jgi:hypothetical protein
MTITVELVAALAPGATVWYAWDPAERAGEVRSYVVDETITRERLVLAAREHERHGRSTFYTERGEAEAHVAPAAPQIGLFA